MKLVVQRVSEASVQVGSELVGKIGKGLFVLVGVGAGDSEKDVDALAEKLYKLRIMSDSEDKMNLSVADVSGSFLVVSQFTLYADTSKGNRPSFIKAAPPKLAQKLYNYFVKCLRDTGMEVATGSFGAYMNIKADIDGPVTIILES